MVVFVHGLDQGSAVAWGAGLEGEAIGPFAQEEQTGSIGYCWQFLLEFLPSCLEEDMTGVFVSVAPWSLCELSQLISNQAGGMVRKEMPV